MIKEFKKYSCMEKILIICFFLIFVCQLIWIAYINLFQLQYHIGYDASAYYLKSVEMMRQKTLFISNWAEQTNMYIDSNVPLAAVLYAITGNIFISWGISNLFVLFAILVCFYGILKYFCKRMLSVLVSLNLLIGAYNMCSIYIENELGYSNMMYISFACYAVKMLMILLVIENVLDLEHKKINWFLQISTLILLFFSGLSSGTYILITAILPSFIYLALRMFVKNNWKCFLNKTFAFLFLDSIVLLAGKFFAVNVLGFVARDSQLTWTGIDNFWKGLGLFILGYPQSLGAINANTTIGILTVNGITLAFGWGICFITVFGIFYYFYKIATDKGKDENGLLLVSLYVVNTCIFIFAYMLYTDYAFEVRYMIPLMMFYFIGAGKWIDGLNYNLIVSYFVVIALGVCIIGCDLKSDKDLTEVKTNYDELCELAEHIDGISDTKVVYFMGDMIDARNMRVVDFSRIYKTVAEDGGLHHWGDYLYYDDPSEYPGEVIIVSCNQALENFPYYYEASRFIETVGKYNIYIMDKNIVNSIPQQ